MNMYLPDEGNTIVLSSELEPYIASTYGIAPDYPFVRDPGIAVFRHPDNKKWFAVAMPVSKVKIGLGGGSP